MNEIKSYKGFNKDMTCRGFQFEEGKEYETDGAEVCEKGFHACEMPLDVFRYYPPATSIYHKVEQSGKISKAGDDSKVASSKIKIGLRLSLKKLIQAQVDFVLEKSKKSSAATSGYRSSAATSGDWSSAATSGYMSSAATSGDWSSAATSGDWSSAATSGDWSSAATSGYRSSAVTSGAGSSAATSGEESSAATFNENGIAVACGRNSKAKGVIGSYIVLTEWNDNQSEIIQAKMGRIDGNKLKSNTWYTLKNGEFVEVAEDDS